jgi:hypothetical protein
VSVAGRGNGEAKGKPASRRASLGGAELRPPRSTSGRDPRRRTGIDDDGPAAELVSNAGNVKKEPDEVSNRDDGSRKGDTPDDDDRKEGNGEGIGC